MERREFSGCDSMAVDGVLSRFDTELGEDMFSGDLNFANAALND